MSEPANQSDISPRTPEGLFKLDRIHFGRLLTDTIPPDGFRAYQPGSEEGLELILGELEAEESHIAAILDVHEVPVPSEGGGEPVVKRVQCVKLIRPTKYFDVYVIDIVQFDFDGDGRVILNEERPIVTTIDRYGIRNLALRAKDDARWYPVYQYWFEHGGKELLGENE